MHKISKKKQIILMYVVVSVAYFVSYTTRVNYNTILVEISSAENIARSLLSLPLTASFITYGVGQVISGWLGDRFNPFRIITSGLLLSTGMNILLPLFPEPHLMTGFWAVNGFAQALIYPPLMKITEYYLSSEKYARASLYITIGSHVATMVLYIVSPVIISVLNWKFVFVCSFTCSIIFIIIWQIYSGKVRREYGDVILIGAKIENDTPFKKTDEKLFSMFKRSGLLLIMLAVVMQGFLRDGIMTWMPAYLSDSFSLSNEISILTTVILPIFSIFSAYVILAIRDRFCRDELKLAGITFVVATAAIILILCFRFNMLVSVLLLAITSSCAQAINFLLIYFVPVKFKDYGIFSLVIGLVNSCTYIGAAISIYGFALISEGWGWNVSLIIWGILAVLGALCCLTALKRWRRFS